MTKYDLIPRLRSNLEETQRTSRLKKIYVCDRHITICKWLFFGIQAMKNDLIPRFRSNLEEMHRLSR